jgi:hypothetical protein
VDQRRIKIVDAISQSQQFRIAHRGFRFIGTLIVIGAVIGESPSPRQHVKIFRHRKYPGWEQGLGEIGTL